jgi:ATP-binding cassette subfamily B protein
MTRVTQDVNELNNFLVDGLQILVVNGLTIAGIVAVLLAHNVRLTLLVLLPVPLVVLVTRRNVAVPAPPAAPAVAPALAPRRRPQLGPFRGARREGVRPGGPRDRPVQSPRDRPVPGRAFVEQWWATLFPLLNFLMTAGTFIVWYVGGRQVIGDVITLGTLQMFLFFLGQLYGPLQGMTRIADWLQRAMTAAERVFEILDTEPDVADAADAVPLPPRQGEVEFRNVSFGYDASRRVRGEPGPPHRAGRDDRGWSATAAPARRRSSTSSRGSTTRSRGRCSWTASTCAGCASTTCAASSASYCQEPFLFPGTVAENISYAKPDATPEEIMRAAKAANAHDFIMRFPDGYDTQVGERGTRLSGGERQRLSIARAVLHDPRILILDEATASVDTETEKQIQEAIARLIRDRTTFAIAHRLSTLRNADRLLVMDKGKIVELGTHDELMAKPEGVFRRLVEMQTEINQLRAL